MQCSQADHGENQSPPVQGLQCGNVWIEAEEAGLYQGATERSRTEYWGPSFCT